MAAWLLAACTVIDLVAALALLALNADLVSTSRMGFYAVLAVAVMAYVGTGGLIASRLPGNVIGWLLGLIGLSLAAAMLAEQHALYGVASAPWSLPAARLAGWGSGVFVSLAVTLLFCLVVLFPDGRLPSRRWRPVLWSVCAVAAGWAAQQLQAGTSISGGLTNALDAARASYPNPLGIFPRHGWFSGLIAVIYGLGVATGILAVASVLVRRRRASAEARKQLAWLGYVGLMTAVWVAVLKYRLYDIDRIISRTLAYAIVTGLLVGIYAGLVLLATQVFRFADPIAVAASTLAAAALFNPVRKRVQSAVNRRFNRTRYDADQTAATFAAQLKDATDLNTISDDLAAVVSRALEPAHVSVWISRRD